MPSLPLVALVAALFFVSPAHAFNWTMYLPAITGCDSYPFPSCRGRSTCRESGKYWYNGQCNQTKHPDQDVLEKLDGLWKITCHMDICGGPSSFSMDQLSLDKSLISDDNVQVTQFEGRAMSIAAPDYSLPQGSNVATDHTGPYYRYAILGHSAYTYVLKDVNITWSLGIGCLRPDGTPGPGVLDIPMGDTVIYSFDLATPTTMKGRACFVAAGACLNFTGELLQPAAAPPLRRGLSRPIRPLAGHNLNPLNGEDILIGQLHRLQPKPHPHR